jgi:hypothetical protein
MTIDQAITLTGAAKGKLTRAFIHLQNTRRLNFQGTPEHEVLAGAWEKLDMIQGHLGLIKRARITQL